MTAGGGTAAGGAADGDGAADAMGTGATGAGGGCGVSVACIGGAAATAGGTAGATTAGVGAIAAVDGGTIATGGGAAAMDGLAGAASTEGGTGAGVTGADATGAGDGSGLSEGSTGGADATRGNASLGGSYDHKAAYPIAPAEMPAATIATYATRVIDTPWQPVPSLLSHFSSDPAIARHAICRFRRQFFVLPGAGIRPETRLDDPRGAMPHPFHEQDSDSLRLLRLRAWDRSRVHA